MFDKNNLIIVNSGGTTPVINSTIYGAIDQSKKLKNFNNIYVSHFGVDGLISGDFINIKKIKQKYLIKLKHTPGSAFGISRNPKISKKNFIKIKNNIKKNKITHLINIGGNGSLEQTLQFKKKIENLKYIAFAPKTVDNDLGDKNFKKIFFTPGFPTCINFWIKVLKFIDIENRAAKNHDKVIVCQTFGRDTGHITAAARMFDLNGKLPILYLMPEVKKKNFQILKKIKKLIKIYGRAIIIIGEGYNIGKFKIFKDEFGQSMFGSSSSSAAQSLIKLLVKHKIQARYFLPTILQRVNDFSFLKKDNIVAENIGRNIIREFQKNNTDFMCTISSDDKRIFYSTIKLKECTNFKRKLDKDYIDENNFNVSSKYINYLKRIKKFTGINVKSNFKKKFFEYEKI